MLKFIRKTSVARKLLMISGAYTLPIAVMLFFIVSGLNQNIHTSSLELAGTEYQRPLQQLLRALPRHALLVRDNAPRDQITTEQSSIEQAIDTLETADRKLGEDLQFTDDGLTKRNRGFARASNLRSQWTTLKAQSNSLTPDDLVVRHRALVATVREMITHAGDTSNLILDPNLDSRYVMDATLVALPQTQDRMAVMVLDGTKLLNEKSADPALRTQLAIDAAIMREVEVDRITETLRTALAEDPNFNGISESLQSNLPGVLQTYVAAAESFHEMTKRLAAGDVEISSVEYAAAGKKALDQSFRLWQVAAAELDTLLRTRVKLYREERATALSLTAFSLALTAAFVWLLMRSINTPLRAVVELLTGNAEQVAAASGQLAGSSQSLAQGASEQAASLEETSSSLKEMSGMTRRTAETAQQTRTLSADAQSAATRGNDAMTRMSAAITQIEKSASETGKIIKVIDEIAFQTNLLALNAAVEAARAGEAGKGFAVVAEEVRNLAMRSTEAARNTSAMIEQSVQSARGGIAIVGDVGKVLVEITSVSTRVNELIGEIAGTAQNQAQGIDQVNTAVSQMDRVTQSNAANAEETAAAGEELASQAEQLSGAVQELVRLVGGAAKRDLRTRTVPSKRRGRDDRSPLSVQASKLIPFDDAEDQEGDRDFSEFNRAA